MAELVDAIIADLSVRYEQYVSGFDKATAAHERFKKSVPKVGALGGFTAAEAKQYADRHTQVGEAAEKSATVRKRAAKGASDTEKAEAKAAAAAVKQAAKEKEQAERAAARAAAAAVRAAEREKQAELKATQREQQRAAAEAARRAEVERAAAAAVEAAAQREAAARARLAAVAQRAVDRRATTIAPATSSRIGATVPREGTGQSAIPLNVLNGDARAEALVENEINHLLADRAVLQSRLATATGAERQVIRDRLGDLRLEQTLRRAGLDDEAIVLRLEERRTKLAADRAIAERKGANQGLKQFAEGAGIGRSFGSTATVAGIATAVGVGVGVEVIRSAVEYGKALDNLSKQLGITVEDLQAYEKIARDTGVETTTLSSAFGQFASNLGRAQQGGEEQSKVFKALGIDIANFSSAGDALPTVIDRISQLQDPLQRAAIETRLFGEEGRKLDPLLSGGSARVSELAAALQETGRALSAKEIQELDETGRKLSEVKNALQVDLARVVAGNAEAIIGLANSFGTLSGRIIDTIGRLQQFGAQQIRNGAIARFAGKDDKEAARQFLLSTPSGRQSLFTENTNAINANIRRYRILPNDDKLLAAQPAGAPRLTVAELKRRQLAAANAGLLQERQSIRDANNAATFTPTPAVQDGNVNAGLIRTLGAPKPPKGPKGKSAEQIEREAEQRTRQFNDQIAQAAADYLRAQQQLTGSTEKRAAIELELLETAYKARLADIDSQEKRNVLAGADAKLEASRAAELKAAEKKSRDAQASAIEQDKRFDIERALTASTQSLLDARATVLSAELSMAQTAAERRRIQLALVDLQDQQERNRLNGIIKSSPADSDAAKQAQADLARLPGQTDAARRATQFGTRGPLEQYRDELPRTADQINEALEGVKVRGLQSLDDAITSSISKVFKLGGAFGDVANSIISDLIRIGVQRAIIAPLADSLFGAAGAGGGGGGIAKVLGSIGGLFGGGGRASGGNIVAGVPYDIGENGPETVVFGQSGRVYPNGALPPVAGGRGGSTVVHQHFQLNAPGAIGFREFVGGIQNYVDTKGREAGGAVYKNAVRDAPVRAAQQRPLKG